MLSSCTKIFPPFKLHSPTSRPPDNAHLLTGVHVDINLFEDQIQAFSIADRVPQKADLARLGPARA